MANWRIAEGLMFNTRSSLCRQSSMRTGPVIAILILAGYVGFEAWVVKRSGHLIEPLNIFDQYIAIDRAATACGALDEDQRKDFQRNLDAVTRRARDDLAQIHATEPASAIDRRLRDRADVQRASVDAVIGAGGCQSKEIWKLLKLHEQRARLNLR
jgi:hypothetical protein